MIKAVIFDIDNTLTSDVSWLKITELLGAPVSAHEDIFEKFSAGKLSYPEAKERLLKLWQATGKADKTEWQRLFADWPLDEAAASLVRYLQTEGYKTAIITGSVDLFAQADQILRDLGALIKKTRLHGPGWLVQHPV